MKQTVLQLKQKVRAHAVGPVGEARHTEKGRRFRNKQMSCHPRPHERSQRLVPPGLGLRLCFAHPPSELPSQGQRDDEDKKGIDEVTIKTGH